jgi:hypothetical protein
MDIKTALLNSCNAFVNSCLQTVQQTISSNTKALQTETKSSAGDKHETGRAMLQLETEKAGLQLANITQMQTILAKIEPTKLVTVGCLGSLITTTNGTYFLAISAGQITLNSKVYFAVSTASPIGKLLLGKTVGDAIIWHQKI